MQHVLEKGEVYTVFGGKNCGKETTWKTFASGRSILWPFGTTDEG
jgi:hypothetical protein